MSFQYKAAVIALAATFAAPTSVWAFGGGGPGCSDLPEYDRAMGALEGLSTCDMTVEQARRIVAAQRGPAAVYQQAAPTPYVHHRHHHRMQAPQP